tara:strand:- start:2063 stop:2710 length:648 start_codon:yes stop_codon:yes gene_type:complete
MFLELDKIIKRVLTNKKHMLYLSIIIVSTIIITMHFSPAVIKRNIDNKGLHILCIILIGVSIYYRSFMLGLVVVISMVVIRNYARSFQVISGYSDDSIFSQVKELTELYGNIDDEEAEDEEDKEDEEDEDEEDKEDSKDNTPVEDQDDDENTTLSLSDQISKSTEKIQQNEFPETSKQSNTESPILGTDEYCAQGDLPNAPTGYDPFCSVACETL